MLKKLAFIVFILLLVFSCSKEKVAAQTVEELALETNFIGKYVFSSINIEESENIDISKYKDLDESIYIEIKKVDVDKYKITSNFWLLAEEMNLDKDYDNFYLISISQEMNIDFSFTDIPEENIPIEIRQIPFLKRNSYFVFSHHGDYITIDYSYEDSYLEKVNIDISNLIIIVRDKGGIATYQGTTTDAHYSPFSLMIKCSIVFKKIEI